VFQAAQRRSNRLCQANSLEDYAAKFGKDRSSVVSLEMLLVSQFCLNHETRRRQARELALDGATSGLCELDQLRGEERAVWLTEEETKDPLLRRGE